jgi:hypothetical protein
VRDEIVFGRLDPRLQLGLLGALDLLDLPPPCVLLPPEDADQAEKDRDRLGPEPVVVVLPPGSVERAGH